MFWTETDKFRDTNIFQMMIVLGILFKAAMVAAGLYLEYVKISYLVCAH